MAILESWVPGAVAPSTKTQVLLRYAGRDVGASVVAIRIASPRSRRSRQMRQGRWSRFIVPPTPSFSATGLRRKSVRTRCNLTVQTSDGSRLSAQVVGLFHSGVRSVDESTAYVLVKTAQILAQQIGLVNEIRVRVGDPMAAKTVAERIERETGYKSVAWQEAHEDLLSAFVIRNIIMYTVVGAILLVASFGTYNIISTITHEKTRDIAILKSLGLSEATVRRIFVLEGLLIGLAGALLGWMLGQALTRLLGTIEFKISGITDLTRLPLAYSFSHYLVAGAVALASSLVAGFFPARAASVHPVDIIRGAT